MPPKRGFAARPNSKGHIERADWMVQMARPSAVTASPSVKCVRATGVQVLDHSTHSELYRSCVLRGASLELRALLDIRDAFVQCGVGYRKLIMLPYKTR